ncbi:MAG: hypothetical protein WDZ41_01895 [Candidatus Babeliales bacterium]
MKLKVNGCVIELFDSIDEVLIDRYNAFQRYLMLDAELGSTIQEYDQKMSKTIQLLSKGLYVESAQEIKNMRLNIWNIIQENNPSHYSFAILVKSFNGKSCKSFKKDDLTELIKKMNDAGLTQGKLQEALSEVKKK